MCGPVQVNLSGTRGERAGEFVIARQVERAFADLAGDDAGGLGAIGHAGVRAKSFEVADGETACGCRPCWPTK